MVTVSFQNYLIQILLAKQKQKKYPFKNKMKTFYNQQIIQQQIK